MTRKPNVIVFFTDQQRWDSVGLHGNAMDLTPNFDRLASQGTFIANSFTCQPVCGPARSMLQTGLYPTTTGCFRNGIPLPKHEKTLAHYFAAAGYETAYIGKWHLGTQDPVPPAERGGYDYWLAANILEFTSFAYKTTVYDNDCNPVQLPGYRVDALTDAAIRYLDRDHDDPFFLVLSFLEPHHQNQTDDYPAPVGYEDRLRKRLQLPEDLSALGGTSAQHYAGYMGMVSRLDDALGRLTDALISLDMLDDTIILFTSDHGCHFKTRNDEYKRSCHEASIRVPTMLHGPGFMNGGRFSGHVGLIDLPPTLLDAAGVKPPDRMQGKSLLRSDGSDHDSVFIQISESHVGRALRTARWKYGVWAPGKDGHVDMGSDRYEEAFLYDLQDDPAELNNLVRSPAHLDILAELRLCLEGRIRALEDISPEIVPASPAADGAR